MKNDILNRAAMPLLLFSGVFIFYLSDFVPFLAFFVYVPVFFLIKKSSLKFCLISGLIYGFFIYALLLNWLLTFNRIAFFIVCFYFSFLFFILFLFLKIIFDFFKKYGVFFSIPLICGFEFLRTQGFLGFSYGIAGYFLSSETVIIQMADLFGVWIIEVLVVYSSAEIFYLIDEVISKKRKIFTRNIVISLGSFISFFLILFIYGKIKINSIENHEEKLQRKLKVCSVQNNSDPWQGDFEHYKKDVDVLIRLTEDALSLDDDIDVVLWPETAVVPSILQNYYFGNEINRKELVEKILLFFDKKKCIFVIGNFNQVGQQNSEKDFNSVLVFRPGKNVFPPEPEVYDKIHLVPFAEYFPYDKQFPFINSFLFENDRQWTPGNDVKIFEVSGIKFGTPVCFEDGFGTDCSEFVSEGAEVLFNLSNDAWAKSEKCQKQHLSMSIFRSVENRVPVVRSTASGETCIISSCGKIDCAVLPFSEGYVTKVLGIPCENVSFYTQYPDLLGKLFLLFSIVLLIVTIILKSCIRIINPLK